MNILLLSDMAISHHANSTTDNLHFYNDFNTRVVTVPLIYFS